MYRPYSTAATSVKGLKAPFSNTAFMISGINVSPSYLRIIRQVVFSQEAGGGTVFEPLSTPNFLHAQGKKYGLDRRPGLCSTI
ncbi:hypothetical protein MBAV_004128 [Candidatus Magnetobacterium bavaricum]|uniref:Uncharacterized protein n=1 Tax=Candidatus Magnetobacterium bavaricum TaxID=29290 RepID=A0A0F3GNW8_9BACT|nr:hypothetical protein MBAV_004128 [Candidatus Magnetobacterium bavaricum]